MRSCLLAAVAAALLMVPVSASAQYGRGGGYCRELRLACENKDALGERGQGNCRRYREECGGPSRRDICAELRRACLYKDELGERGRGNCRQYRETCR
ncbi:hypothetical protein QW694_22325 [Methylobacterium isbiliense]|jgi:hypothetical protein|nr:MULTISPECIES: hypothetical protein [Methylobacterium]MDN3625772.1 hypothetical protein [Methylobacterium isbiliense]